MRFFHRNASAHVQQPPRPTDYPDRFEQLGFQLHASSGVQFVIPPMCDVPPGPFLMGSDPTIDKRAEFHEEPQHSVTLTAFQIGRFPVTVAEYAYFVRAGGNEPQRWEPRKKQGKLVHWQAQLQQPDHPVVCVSWRDAAAYAAWLANVVGDTWRLPTEAEWEKAARGTDSRIYPWGNNFDRARCNTDESSTGTTTSVGTYIERGDASPYGLHEMAGNVWEWTSSLYKPYPYQPQHDAGDADLSGKRVRRGGGWTSPFEYARTAYRDHYDPVVIHAIGFRLARSPRAAMS